MDSTKKAMESISQTLSTQRAIMPNFDTEGFRRATDEINQPLSSRQVLKSDYKIADGIEDGNK